MSHVDEGLIHAYIDGAFPPGNPQGEEIEAHTALCVDCRVRLEKARELKERAQVVMHRLAPTSIATPPFEEVLARRDRLRAPAAVPPARQETQRGNRRRSDIFPIPFAWAATVILAVGAGWMGRELVLNQRVGTTDQAAAVLESAAEAPAALGAPPPVATEGSAGADASALSDRDGPAAADRARQEAPQRQERAAEAASGFAAPPAARKAADATVSQRAAADVRRDSTPPVLQAIEARVSPQEQRRMALGAATTVVTEPDSTNASSATSVLAAYVRATANAGWVEEPGAAVGIIGYERPARIEGLDAARSERAVVDSVELLRTVYVVDGDTVELVQRLKQAAVALESIVVTGVDRADSLAGRRPPVAAPPPPTARAGDERAANRVREAERAALDTASAFTGRSLVAVPHDGRVLVLISRMSEESLRGIAARIR